MSKANKSEKVSPDLDTPTDLPQAAELQPPEAPKPDVEGEGT